MPTALLIDGTGSSTTAARVNSSGALHVFLDAQNSAVTTLTVGSYIPLNLVSGVWNFTSSITNLSSWAVSISGGATQFDVSGRSGTTMIYHTVPTNFTLFAEDTQPTIIGVRTASNISGVIEMWSP